MSVRSEAALDRLAALFEANRRALVAAGVEFGDLVDAPERLGEVLCAPRPEPPDPRPLLPAQMRVWRRVACGDLAAEAAARRRGRRPGR